MDIGTISNFINSLSSGFQFEIRNFVKENKFYIKISDHNYTLHGTDYYYDEDLTFVHFTNIFAFQDIIRQKKIRLYNLHNLNDPQELIYAFKYVEPNIKKYENARTNLHVFSMCEKTIINNEDYIKDEFNLWRLYGDNGKGVAISFKILNNPKKWTGYHLSKVHYNEEKLRHLKSIYDKIISFVNNKADIVFDLGKLLCFNKSPLFDNEKEVRLLYDEREFDSLQKESKINLKDERFTITKRKFDLSRLLENKYFISYIELPIYPNKVSDKIPLLKIDKVYLGYKYDISRIPFLARDEYRFTLYRELGYSPEITTSKLSNYFNKKESSDYNEVF